MDETQPNPRLQSGRGDHQGIGECVVNEIARDVRFGEDASGSLDQHRRHSSRAADFLGHKQTRRDDAAEENRREADLSARKAAQTSRNDERRRESGERDNAGKRRTGNQSVPKRAGELKLKRDDGNRKREADGGDQ